MDILIPREMIHPDHVVLIRCDIIRTRDHVVGVLAVVRGVVGVIHHHHTLIVLGIMTMIRQVVTVVIGIVVKDVVIDHRRILVVLLHLRIVVGVHRFHHRQHHHLPVIVNMRMMTHTKTIQSRTVRINVQYLLHN